MIIKGSMPLRKANIAVSGTPSANMGSFVNVTARRLHIRKLDLSMIVSATVVALDQMALSVDEVPIVQQGTNDSRSHIMAVRSIVGDSTGAGLSGTPGSSKILSFNRNDLVLDPDEAIFLNGSNIVGDPTFDGNLNVWYED